MTFYIFSNFNDRLRKLKKEKKIKEYSSDVYVYAFPGSAISDCFQIKIFILFSASSTTNMEEGNDVSYGRNI